MEDGWGAVAPFEMSKVSREVAPYSRLSVSMGRHGEAWGGRHTRQKVGEGGGQEVGNVDIRSC